MAEHVLTRTVRDTAAVLDAIHGYMPGDVFVAPPPLRPYREEVGRIPPRLRVGVLVEDIFLKSPVHAECSEAVRQTASLLESLGHSVEEAYPPAIDGPSGLGEAMRIVSSSGLAARLDAWSERIGRKLSEADVSKSVWQRAQIGRSYSAVQVHWAVSRLANGAMRAPEWWSSGFDLLITPTASQLPPRWDEYDQSQEGAIWGLWTMPFSISGQPAVSLPMHWTTEGLPVGVQLVAAYAREDLLLQVSSQLEAARPWVDRIPAIHA